MKRVLTIIVLIFCGLPLFAQEGKIENVRFRQDGSKVIIDYYLDLEKTKKMRNVKAYIGIDKQYTPLKRVRGDVGTVLRSGEKSIEADIFGEFGNQPIEGLIDFKVTGVSTYVKRMWMIEYIYSPTAPYGFSIGTCKRWGWYLNCKFGDVSDRNITNSMYDFESLSNKKGYSRLDIIGGAMFRVHRLVYLYGGLGYGSYKVGYELVDDDGNSYLDNYYCTDSRQGLAFEVGARVILCKLVSISGGWNGIVGGKSPMFSDFHIGLGFMF